VTLPELERNMVATLALAVIAGREDPDRFTDLGWNATVLLEMLHDAGGLEQLVAQCRAQGTRARGRGRGEAGDGRDL
jgi:hypothetical protein